MQRFYQALAITPQTKILDVGANAFILEIAAQNGLPAIEHVTVLNIYEEDKTRLPANVTWFIGDGCSLPFADVSWLKESSTKKTEALMACTV